MGRTFIRQNIQIRNSVTYTDNLTPGSTLESSAVSIEDDLNGVRSQVSRILGQTKWYDDVGTVNSKKRDLIDLNTDLDDLEEKRIICPVEKLVNVTVPAAVQATGSITVVAGSALLDAETFTISDGYTSHVYEFDIGGGGITGDVAVVLTGSETAGQVRDAIISAVNGDTLLITASIGGASVVTLTQEAGGTRGNTTITDTVADAGFTVTSFTGGAGDVVVLTVSGSTAPSDTAAVTANYLGAIVASLTGDVGANSLAAVTGANPITPRNRCIVRDAVTKEGFVSGQTQIYGLIQAESGVVDGDTFSDTTKQVQISFVRINSTEPDSLEPCPAEDIAGKVIEYVYPKRVSLDTIPQDVGFPFFPYTDSSASVSVTLNNAIDNQSTTPATQDTDIFWDITTGSKKLTWRDALSAELLTITEGSSGGNTTVAVSSNVDYFDVNAVDVDFVQGIKVDSGGQQIDIGQTAGLISSTSTNDLQVQGAGELYLDDGNRSGSSWATDGIKLTDTQSEWTAFETAMEGIFGTGAGEVSILKAITGVAGNHRKDKVYAIVTSNVSADSDAGGPASSGNLDVNLPDMSGGTFLVDYDVYLNGMLLRPGANAAANNDYYPGTSLVNGQLKFEFNLHATPGNPDVICVVPYT